MSPATAVLEHLSDRAALESAITARIGGERLPVGPLGFKIADTLYLGAQKDIEDTVHLYTGFPESLRTAQLEKWVRRLDIESEYA